LPSYSVLAADTLRELVALTFDLLISVSGHTWRVIVNLSTNFGDLWLSVLELCVLIFIIRYHWECVCRHCACAVSR